ncbi:MAG: zinc ABC transporter substrate-binding protein [Chlamydiales bacterium]|nr:zinc ABC transporter substrate-binding protein [Chlamydiales bacterium]
MLVSVAPYKYLVHRIAGDTVTVGMLVPPSANVHTYEPTFKEVLAAGKADLWFRIGETFEPRVARALTAHNSNLELVDLRQGLDLIAGECQCSHHGCCHPEGMDLHIWLSPRLMKQQAKTLTAALSRRYPANAKQYQQALHEHLKELDALDAEMAKQLESSHGKTILVTHPAYAYICRDYGFKQMPVEIEGKDPAPRQLTELINRARHLRIKTIYTQSQYSDKVAKLLANQLDAKLVKLDPYAEDYMQNLRTLSQHFSEP